jgi:uncharacterized membrane protein YGL010W
MQLMKKSLEEYMREYAAHHTQPGTKLTHMFGIPMILASLPLAPVALPASAGLFLGGWTLQFIGHYVFEKNDPQFFGDPFNLIVGVIWAAVEWARLLGIELPVPGAQEHAANA